ncbi:hypothetical protein QUC32_08270 [Novosphingobium resinovorum]|uniref:DUF7064 domain-containing protein n=1 Tax=Novosphingobium TaxID=165696 RepID=UPI001B3C9CED|nr:MULTISPECIES: hypothetical protein [Novosphingobium]MBF7014376.1 hypothetical protein [Novosphingobium sp. HR1a]WJM25141.1 hypothetical protein QUC32_08270 [Novosphingobium resinovorum]
MAFDPAALARPAMAIDPVHDGRHALPDLPLMRESIPYCVVLPEHEIALFTYTWVDKDGMAGAAMGIWGRGLGRAPIAVRLPDRKVPDTMGFDDWRIDDFTMRQDLSFNRAEISWRSEEAEIAFTYEAFHPPYAYSTHKDGCPSYAADDRIEQSGRVSGTLRIGTRTIDFTGSGHRDHSWGRRDWDALHYYRWFQGQSGDAFSVHFWEFYALGRRQVRGYVYKDAVMAEIATLDVDWQGDSRLDQTAFQCDIVDKLGRATRVEGDVFGVFPLPAAPNFVLNEGAARLTIDGNPGGGWMEMGWPISYLEHVRAAGVY